MLRPEVRRMIRERFGSERLQEADTSKTKRHRLAQERHQEDFDTPLWTADCPDPEIQKLKFLAGLYEFFSHYLNEAPRSFALSMKELLKGKLRKANAVDLEPTLRRFPRDDLHYYQ